MNNIKKFTASLHTHVESLFDAMIDAKLLCKRISEMGGTACAITDHGALSAIEDYRRTFEDNNLKFIPGCELYVDGGVLRRLHLVVLAKDYEGYLGICKMVTAANYTLQDGYPVISQAELLNIASKYQGHIFALSACMQGVLSSVFLQNSILERKVAKATAKRDSYTDPYGDEMHGMESLVDSLNKKKEALTIERDNLKIIAEQKFSKRETAIKKAEKNGEDVREAIRVLEQDKKDAKEASEKLEPVKNELKTVCSKITAINKECVLLTKSAQKWLAKNEEIKSLLAQCKSDEELEVIATEVATLYENAFGSGFFYAELQYHGIDKERECFTKVLALAKELGLPTVATNDVHILTNSEDDRLVRRLLRSLRFGNAMEEETDADKELYLKDNYELLDALKQILPEEDAINAIKGIDTIVNACDVQWPSKPEHYPVFSRNEDTATVFDREVENGVKWRFPNGLSPEYRERLEYEKSVIKKMGYVDYHLIVKDFLEYGRLMGYVPSDRIAEAPLDIPALRAWIKENSWTNPGMTIGNGRGSAAGSLVCYCLGITSLDPIKYGLLFERFLNIERISMPDIDSDIANEIREKVIMYVRKRFGERAVCLIMTKQYHAPKKALGTAANFYALSKGRNDGVAIRNILSVDVPGDPNVSFMSKVNAGGAMDSSSDTTLYDFMLSKHEDNADYCEVIRWAKLLEGTFTAYSSHAAGVVISDNDDVSEYIPLRYNTTAQGMTTQCDMVQVEELGLLKFDFLGLKTLDIITGAMRLILKNHGVQVDPYALNMEDAKVYEMLQSGKTKAVFQFESAGMTDTIKKMRPTCFEDLIIIVSMYRPGPMQFIDDVVAVKNGSKEAEYLCPELKPILGKTYGAIVYQEQVMEIFQKLAGYTLGGADMVRRYMSKKKADKLAHEREAFINGDSARNIAGCVANGINADAANKLFDQMMAFAAYAFNKSHAACYAYNSYITAWLKCYYPAEYLTSALNWARDSDKIASLMHEVKSVGIKVMAPDVNVSDKAFTCRNGIVYFGLSSVSGIGASAGAIIVERERGAFKSLTDFVVRCNPNATVANNLIAAGACDAFHNNREAMKKFVADIGKVVDVVNGKRSFIASAEFVLPKVESFNDSEFLKAYQKDNGYKAEISECTTVEKLEKRIATAKSTLVEAEEALRLSKITYVKESATKRMNEEKDLLGVYVTASPMDSYPKAEEVFSTAVSDAGVDTKSVYGIVSNLKIKQRKKDGANMAFFNLEDASGSIEVAMFTNAYAKYGKLLKDGVVLIVYGKTEVETFGEDERLKVFAESVKTVDEKKKAIMLSVSSYPVFHAEAENAFIKAYKSDTGRDFFIYEEIPGTIRKMNYCVNEKLLSSNKAREIAM